MYLKNGRTLKMGRVIRRFNDDNGDAYKLLDAAWQLGLYCCLSPWTTAWVFKQQSNNNKKHNRLLFQSPVHRIYI